MRVLNATTFGGGRVSFSLSLPLRDRILFSTNVPFLQVKC